MLTGVFCAVISKPDVTVNDAAPSTAAVSCTVHPSSQYTALAPATNR